MSELPKTRPRPQPRRTASGRRRAVTEALRRAIRGIEEAASPEAPHLSLGAAEIDRALPGRGLRLGCIHEVTGDEAATGFCASLLARAASAQTAAGRPGSLLWLSRGSDLYAPGLVRFGIEAGCLIVVTELGRDADMLWAMEEALRCPAVSGVVAETGGMGLAAARRLMLAAEGTGVLGLALSQGGDGAGRRGAAVRSAYSRWRVTRAAVSGHARRRVSLLHCRGGKPAEWLVRWTEDGWRVTEPAQASDYSAPATPADSALVLRRAG